MKRRGGNKRRLKAARRAWRKRIHLIGWMREMLDKDWQQLVDGEVGFAEVGKRVHERIIKNS